MLNPISPINLHKYCLDKLRRILDLTLQTAEAASAEAKHRIVLQAAREVTRIVTLMNRMASTLDQESAEPLSPSTLWMGMENPFSSNSVRSGKNAPDIPGHSPELQNGKKKPDSGSQPPKTRNTEPEISLDPTSFLEAHYPELENLFEKWEISGKIPGNDPLVTNIIKNYQEVIQFGKDAFKAPEKGYDPHQSQAKVLGMPDTKTPFQ